MKRLFKTAIAVFVALGAMISFLPRDARTRTPLVSDEPQEDITRHFAAVWEILGNVVAHNEE